MTNVRYFNLIAIPVGIVMIIIIGGGCGSKIDQTIFVQPDYNELKWKQTEFTVTTGTQVKLVMDNIATGIENVMSHNVVLLVKGDTAADRDALIEEVGKAATEAGEGKEYFPEGHPAILLRTPLAGPGQRTEIIFTAPEPGDYPYICTFAGHWKSMRGVIHVVP